MNYKTFLDLTLSEIGIGTYLGNPDEETNQNYKNTIKKGIELGVNVVDTAINYRDMESERTIGEVIKEVGREKLIISTKGGYFPRDKRLNIFDITKYLKENFLEKGIITKEDITPYGNIITPKYIDWSFEKSLQNLNTDYLDVYFLHNPEDQLQIVDKEKFYRKLWTVFRLLEGKVNEGKLKYYGLATWNGFRVPVEHKQHLNLFEIFNIAKEVGGENHHFRFIQLPYNLAMTEAYTLKNQPYNNKYYSTLELAQLLGIYTYISAPLFQGRILRPLDDRVKKLFKVEKDIHVPIQFVRSTPGVGTVLIGMSKVNHLLENIQIEEYPKLTIEEFNGILHS
ncbi:aldo/keto reductase [Sulfurihydrogenibium sp.]|uniref:aldo/keto reductase n=1 Tax=Sulfurihydrogenibium sp. TaxID=2053621 RepID=UPI002638D070|nr:aldo/keto reductase [Sulfurihydrogenibium sp.]